MYEELMEDPRLRVVFNLVRKDPGVRFSDIAKRTKMHDPDVADAIRKLKAEDLIWATTIPTKGARVFFSYELAPKGMRAAQFLDVIAKAVRSGPLQSDGEAKDFAAYLEATRV